MAGRPLRPATDRSLGEPLPHQLANLPQAPLQARGPEGSPALTTNHHLVPLHYAVLAHLSASYSPPGGRLPTCYSPGRHSTYPRKGFRVRLACVRHAASVDSEPGSNSQLFFLATFKLSPKDDRSSLGQLPLKLSERLVRFYALSSFQRPLDCLLKAKRDYRPTSFNVNSGRDFYFTMDLGHAYPSPLHLMKSHPRTRELSLSFFGLESVGRDRPTPLR